MISKLKFTFAFCLLPCALLTAPSAFSANVTFNTTTIFGSPLTTGVTIYSRTGDPFSVGTNIAMGPQHFFITNSLTVSNLPYQVLRVAFDNGTAVFDMDVPNDTNTYNFINLAPAFNGVIPCPSIAAGNNVYLFTNNVLGVITVTINSQITNLSGLTLSALTGSPTNTNAIPGTISGTNGLSYIYNTADWANLWLGENIVFDSSAQYALLGFTNGNSTAGIFPFNTAGTFTGLTGIVYPNFINGTDINGHQAWAIGNDGSYYLVSQGQNAGQFALISNDGDLTHSWFIHLNHAGGDPHGASMAFDQNTGSLGGGVFQFYDGAAYQTVGVLPDTTYGGAVFVRALTNLQGSSIPIEVPIVTPGLYSTNAQIGTLNASNAAVSNLTVQGAETVSNLTVSGAGTAMTVGGASVFNAPATFNQVAQFNSNVNLAGAAVSGLTSNEIPGLNTTNINSGTLGTANGGTGNSTGLAQGLTNSTLAGLAVGPVYPTNINSIQYVVFGNSVQNQSNFNNNPGWSFLFPGLGSPGLYVPLQSTNGNSGVPFSVLPNGQTNQIVDPFALNLFVGHQNSANNINDGAGGLFANGEPVAIGTVYSGKQNDYVYMSNGVSHWGYFTNVNYDPFSNNFANDIFKIDGPNRNVTATNLKYFSVSSANLILDEYGNLTLTNTVNTGGALLNAWNSAATFTNMTLDLASGFNQSDFQAYITLNHVYYSSSSYTDYQIGIRNNSSQSLYMGNASTVILMFDSNNGLQIVDSLPVSANSMVVSNGGWVTRSTNQYAIQPSGFSNALGFDLSGMIQHTGAATVTNTDGTNVIEIWTNFTVGWVKLGPSNTISSAANSLYGVLRP